MVDESSGFCVAQIPLADPHLRSLQHSVVIHVIMLYLPSPPDIPAAPPDQEALGSNLA